MCLGVIDAGFSGGFYDIKFRQSGKFWICDRNDCYTWDGGKNYLQCDDDKGDVGDHVFAIVQTGKYSKNFGAMECCLETSGDLWRDRSGRFLWCDKGTSCKGGNVKFDYGFEFCAMNRTKDMGNKRPLLIDAGIRTENNQTTIKQYVGCLRCQKGYERPDKDYNFTSRDGCSECKVTRDECVPAEMIDCFRAIDRKETANWNGTICYCGSRDGVSYSWNSKQKKCVAEAEDCPEFSRHPKKRTKIPGTNKYYEVTDCVDTGMIDCYEKIQEGFNGFWDGLNCVSCGKDEVPDHKNFRCVKKTPKKTCKELYNNYPERIKCCEAGKATYWEPKNDLINGKCYCHDKTTAWDSKTGKCVKQTNVSCEDAYKGNTEAIACCEAGENWIDGKCECNEENKVWDSKLKKCVANATPVTTCTPSDCYLSINQTVRCNNGNYWKSNERINICKEQLTTLNTCSDLQSKITSCQDVNCINNIIGRIDAYDELIERVCGGSGVVTTPVPDNGAEILAAENTLTSFFRNAESNASVWKDKDGNFNTARLASDLTAGVILGTVGGVVSGVVIKKKQVEKGFDALHCTVGGQTVADWGDIFNVGLRR